MDMRVFPFSFPPIRGGAQGGVSPTPTPDPEPETPLYDLTDAVVTLRAYDVNWKSGDGYKYAVYYISVSGIVVNDSSSVSSMYLDITTLDWTGGGSPISSATLSDGIKQYLNKSTATVTDAVNTLRTSDTTVSGAVGVSGDVTLKVFDADGNVLQEDTITVVGF